MTYTIHGDPAIIVFLLAILGAATILTGIQNWLGERISLDLHPLWHVIPRRFKIRLCWDRPGAVVELSDGREAVILGTYACDGAPAPVALVQPCDEDTDLGPAGWLPETDLTPLPGHSFRETLRAMRGKGTESA